MRALGINVKFQRLEGLDVESFDVNLTEDVYNHKCKSKSEPNIMIMSIVCLRSVQSMPAFLVGHSLPLAVVLPLGLLMVLKEVLPSLEVPLHRVVLPPRAASPFPVAEQTYSSPSASHHTS